MFVLHLMIWNQLWIFIGKTDAEAEAPVLWPPDAKSRLIERVMLGKIEGKRRRGQQRMRWLDSIGSPPGSPIPGILQARTLEWVAISFSNAWKWKVKVKLLSHVRPSATPWTAAHQAPPSMGFSRQEYWSGVPLPSLELKWTCQTSLNFTL